MNFIEKIIDFFRRLFGGEKNTSQELDIVQRPVPQIHPTNDVIVFDGNSMSYGYAPFAIEHITSENPNVSAVDLSIPGQTTRQMNTHADDVDSIPKMTNGKKTLVAWEIINHINLGGATVHEAVAEMVAYRYKRLAAGYDNVYILSVIPAFQQGLRIDPAAINTELKVLIGSDVITLSWPTIKEYTDDLLHLNSQGSSNVSVQVISFLRGRGLVV